MKKHLITLLVASLLAFTTLFSLADGDKRDHDTVLKLKQSGDILSLEQILSRARAIHPGKVIETELEHNGKDYLYELEILDPEGRVWEMKFDARSGKLITEQQDD